MILISLTALLGSAENHKQSTKWPDIPAKLSLPRDRPPLEPSYQGKPLSYWLSVIRNRDTASMPLAFDAIRFLGPDARAAVSALATIVAADFAPIEIGKDSDELILSKIADVELRFEAIDALASIGHAAASSTITLIDWAVTVRLVPPERYKAEDIERFIDLVAMDVEQRVHVILAVVAFGEGATPTVEALLKSDNSEKRKLAVAILGEEALWIAVEWIRSGDCDKAKHEITMLGDMDTVVARRYLAVLKSTLTCHAN
jgi:hypothetical protein